MPTEATQSRWVQNQMEISERKLCDELAAYTIDLYIQNTAPVDLAHKGPPNA
jgi:hypothetical protein